jgi:hypothetical protein
LYRLNGISYANIAEKIKTPNGLGISLKKLYHLRYSAAGCPSLAANTSIIGSFSLTGSKQNEYGTNERGIRKVKAVSPSPFYDGTYHPPLLRQLSLLCKLRYIGKLQYSEDQEAFADKKLYTLPHKRISRSFSGFCTG